MASSLVENWMPPSRENYELILKFWQFGFPILGSAQWIIKWYGMGKTSVASRLNLPGRFAWLTMESPGFLTLLYIMRTLPRLQGIDDLPWQNRVLAGLFVIHYSYRAVIFPFLNPSMSPLHIFVWGLAVCFQLLNATCLGSWLAAYGPTTQDAWAAQSPLPQMALGLLVFYGGLAANYFHDEELREIRRREQRRQEKVLRERQQDGDRGAANGKQQGGAGAVEKHYAIPQAGFFRYVLYAHYMCEWVEWAGFATAAGWTCAPARAFLFNEIATMLPRAVNGRKWYVEKFGQEEVGKRWAVIPGIW